jgi:predicted 2-oxoglutarate/Fe(II)-dependent dioxygenase YbiX
MSMMKSVPDRFQTGAIVHNSEYGDETFTLHAGAYIVIPGKMKIA